jgi:hypothetical protein
MITTQADENLEKRYSLEPRLRSTHAKKNTKNAVFRVFLRLISTLRA